MAAKGPEVRIGLVLYGGVSLAVYIYGIVIEVQRLLRAAAELEAGEVDPGELSPYARALHDAGAGGARVDLLSGTSAGGINGILLAKALARGGDVEAARRLWIEGGDIAQLLQPPSRLDPRSLLQSERFEKRLLEGMELLDAAAAGAPPPPAILDLFVSSTSLEGGDRLFADALGSRIESRQYRYVFQLKLRRPQPGPAEEGEQGYHQDDFEAVPGRNRRLVKLARATSAFPFAFEPVRIDAGDELLPTATDEAWFADGGILNNKPFTEAVETIVNRAADRPVRRWLFSIDPDPKPEAGAPIPRRPPPVDSTVLRSVATIPRYQSIVRDLLALEQHNERVAAAETAIYEAERELVDGRDDAGLGPGIAAATEAMRRQAWGVEVADRLLRAVEVEGRPDTAGVHRAFRFAAEAQQAAARDSSEDATDPVAHRRRLYYLIKLISMAVSGGDELGDVKGELWAEYEVLSKALWTQFSGEPLRLPAGEQVRAAHDLGFERVATALPQLGAVVDRSVARLAPALEGLAVVIAPPSRPHPVSGRTAGDPVSVELDRGFAEFDRRDAILLAAEVYGGLRQRDRIDHAQISPAAGSAAGVGAEGKLAGATLGHFGGFLDRGWRANDLMWGRLDGAEVLIRAILRDGPQGQVKPLTRELQESIFEAERPDLAAEPGSWEEKLRRYAEGDVSAGELNGRRLVSLGLEAASIVRRMLRTAAADAASGTLMGRARAFGLRSAANGLGFLLALLYLPSTALFAKGKFVRRAVTLIFFLPFLWGLATLVLGIVGVLPFSDVVGPAAVAIAVYPAFLVLYWLLSRVAWWLERKLKKLRRRTRQG